MYCLLQLSIYMLLHVNISCKNLNRQHNKPENEDGLEQSKYSILPIRNLELKMEWHHTLNLLAFTPDFQQYLGTDCRTSSFLLSARQPSLMAECAILIMVGRLGHMLALFERILNLYYE